MTVAWKLQRQVDDMLKLGLVLSVVWCGGIDSLTALINGLRAMRIIRTSNGEIVDSVRAW